MFCVNILKCYRILCFVPSMMLRVLELRNYDSVGIRVFCWEEMFREQNSFVSDYEGRRNLFSPPGDKFWEWYAKHKRCHYLCIQCEHSL